MTTFYFRFEDHGVAPMIRQLTVNHSGVVARAMNKVVLDIREAEAKMVRGSFDFWSAVTRSFLANPRTFPFEPATSSKLIAKVHTSPAASEILPKQEEGFTLKPGEGKQLELGNAPASYAIPTKDASAQLRTPRGRVRPSQTPGALVKGTQKQGLVKIRRRRRRKGGANLGTHVFVSPNRKAVIEVTPGGGRRILYGLYQRPIPVKPHIHFFDTAATVIGANMIPKLLKEWDKSFGRF